MSGAIPRRSPPKRCAAKARSSSTTRASDSCTRFIPPPSSRPRDIVARGVFAEIAAGRGAFLDARKLENFAARFPNVYAACASRGHRSGNGKPIPVAPAAHYHMGGVLTDAQGRSSLDGLWAAGEAASTGAHGGNRLASNSLLEAVVFAARIAEDIAGLVPEPQTFDWRQAPALKSAAKLAMGREEMRLRRLMSAEVGVIRSGSGLARALAEISAIEKKAKTAALKDMAIAALMIAAAAYARTESRGAHYRSDFPEADPKQAHRSYFTLDEARAIARRAGAKAA